MVEAEENLRNGIRIRVAFDGDAETLAHLSYRTFSETFAHLNSEENMKEYLSTQCTKEVLARELNDTASTFLLAYYHEEAVGFAKLRRNNVPDEIVEPNAIEIHRLYVIHSMIGKKIGKYLIEKCIELARLENFTAVWLGVWERNDRAIAFYKRFGFEICGTHIFMVGQDAQTDLLMKKIIVR
jgi:ribosomal protein S18 acetylase RimI-like enzyme